MLYLLRPSSKLWLNIRHSVVITCFVMAVFLSVCVCAWCVDCPFDCPFWGHDQKKVWPYKLHCHDLLLSTPCSWNIPLIEQTKIECINLTLVLHYQSKQQDKGGDPATFRETRAAFEVLRSMYQDGSVKNGTFTSYLVGTVEENDIGESCIPLYTVWNYN